MQVNVTNRLAFLEQTFVADLYSKRQICNQFHVLWRAAAASNQRACTCNLQKEVSSHLVLAAGAHIKIRISSFNYEN